MHESRPLHTTGKSLCLHLAICEVPPLVRRDWARLRSAMTQLGMSARAFHRTAQRPAMSKAGLRSVKLARTIADLEGTAEIQTHNLAEAIQYRPRRQA